MDRFTNYFHDWVKVYKKPNRLEHVVLMVDNTQIYLAVLSAPELSFVLQHTSKVMINMIGFFFDRLSYICRV